MSVVEVRAAARRRAAAVAGILAGAILVVAAVTLMLGDLALSPLEVARALVADGTKIAVYIVTQVRFPRLALALLCGAALALSGALLQTLLRNPLASPDLLGISGGASVAAVGATLLLGLPALAVTVMAFGGGIVVAVVLLLAARRIADGGFRLVLAGVGISFLCTAITGYLLKRAQLNDAQAAVVWITGSIGATPWYEVLVVAVVIALAVPAALLAARVLPVVELSDPVAAGLGVRAARVRVGVVVLAVVLAATSTAFIGPVAFIALCAPPIARSMMGGGAPALGASAAIGAVLLAIADLVAQFAIPGVAMPVGVVTGAVGAPYLLWLLASSKGRRS